MSPGAPHRGRFQAQGRTLERSETWGELLPFPAASAHPLLEKLEGRLSAHDRAAREMAFRKAHAAIERAASQGGVPQDGLYPFRKTFRDDPRTSERVDIQVEAGRAFVR